MIIQIDNHTFVLHPTGAAYWQEKKLLLIADVHLGKVAHFRKHGSAVPPEAIAKNFEHLDKAISHFNPKKVYFLGDLFHSYVNTEWVLFERWIATQNVKFTLITGNHDIINPLRYERLGFVLFDKLVIDNFLLTHEPSTREGYFNFCGHIHPGVVLRGRGKQRLRLPCFFKSDHQLIFPAFGTFTGLHILEPDEGNEIFVLSENEVVAMH